jgi:hypothetical protein
MTGSFDLSAGSLGLEAPATLTWSGTLAGVNLQEVDSTDTTFTAVDPTGSGAGWEVTAESTQFTGTSSSSNKLPTSALTLNGSTSSESATTAPTNGCVGSNTCTTATDSVSGYPLTISTSSATPIYEAAVSTGLGAIVIGGGADPAAWWVSVPANAVPDTYTSTITLTITSGP